MPAKVTAAMSGHQHADRLQVHVGGGAVGVELERPLQEPFHCLNQARHDLGGTVPQLDSLCVKRQGDYPEQFRIRPVQGGLLVGVIESLGRIALKQHPQICLNLAPLLEARQGLVAQQVVQRDGEQRSELGQKGNVGRTLAALPLRDSGLGNSQAPGQLFLGVAAPAALGPNAFS